MADDHDRWIHTPPRESATFDRATIAEIHRAAATGIYDIRGFGAKRKLPHFDDLLFLGASISRYPLEGYREKCGTNVVLGTRFSANQVLLRNSKYHRILHRGIRGRVLIDIVPGPGCV